MKCSGIVDLIAATRPQGQGDQERGFLQREEFEEGGRARARDNALCRGKKMGQVVGGVFKLRVPLGLVEGRIEIALPAQVTDLVLGEQIGKRSANRRVHRTRSQATPHDERDGFCRREPAQIAALLGIAMGEFRAHGNARVNRFLRGQVFGGFGKGMADAAGERKGEFVG